MRSEHIVYIIAVLAILIMGGVLALGVLYPNGLMQNNHATVVLSASGSVNVAPQQGVLTLYLNGTGLSSGVATSNLSFTLAQVNSTLTKYTNSSSITTQSYTLWKQYNSSQYQASETVQVKLLNVSDMSPAIQGLSVYKNVFVSSATGQLSDAQQAWAIKTALAAAIMNATAQAEAVTNNASLTIKNITVSNYRVFYPGLNAAVSSGASSSSPVFLSGSETVTQNVQVVFAYQ